MLSSKELSQQFFKDLKQYNSTNFRTLATKDVNEADPETYKAFSSVVTRYFIFADKHPEVTSQELRMLYFKLKIDMIAKYFSEYPEISADLLRPFQIELQTFVQEGQHGAA